MSSRRARWPALLLLPLCAALYLPGLRALPAVDRDEARYVQATREMIAAGPPIVPRLQGAPRLAKPIGIYWLQAGALALNRGGDALAAQRLPSLAGALLAVLGTFAIGRRWFAAPVAWLGAGALAASALLVVEAHLATTDAVLLACVVGAQACLASLYRDARRGRSGNVSIALGFWLAQAAAVLVKGPVGPVISGLTVLALLIADRRAALLAALRPWWGIPLALAGVLPWSVAAGRDVGWQVMMQAMAGDLLPKLTGGHESHGLPPGSYLLLAPLTFWPASLVLLFAAPSAWRRRRRTSERFLLAWLLPAWLAFELVPTKLPHYVLPLYPALALLVARGVCAAPGRVRPAPTAAPVRALELLWAVGTAAAGWLPLLLASRLDEPIGPRTLLGALPAAALAVAGGSLAWRGHLRSALCIVVLGAAAFYGPLLQWTLPGIDALWPSRGAAAAVARAGGERPLAAVGYHEPSLLVATGGEVALLDADAAAAFLATHRDGLVLVAAAERTAFVAAARREGLTLRSLWSAPGVNVSKGERVDLHLFGR